MHSIVRITLLSILVVLLSWQYQFALSTIHWILYVLSIPLDMTLTLHLSAMHLFFVLIILSVTSYILVVQYFMRRYSKLKAVPERGPYELPPVAEAATEEGEDYLATFLASIRIFGYLEQDAYQELVKSLDERTLREGECLKMDGRDFYVVVEGLVQLQMASGRPTSVLTRALESLEGQDERGEQEISVLTQVRPGGILSSLFDVLSIFTESKVSKGPMVTAIAMVPSRLLMIPERAFISLAEKYPKVSAHIVQVIMSRFQRVTFLTLQKYLGLSREAMRIEQSLNEHRRFVREHTGTGKDANTEQSSERGDHDDSEKSDPNVEKNFESQQEEPSPAVLLPTLKDLFGTFTLPTGLADAMTMLTREGRERAQQQIFAYIAQIFGIDLSVDSPTGKSSGNLWEVVSLSVVPPDAHLVRQGDRNPGLFILIHGKLTVTSHPQTPRMDERILFELDEPGSLIGCMAAFLGQHSMVTVTAKEECLVALVGKRQLEWIVLDKHPKMLLTLAGRLLERLSPMVRAIDLALEWLHLNAGQVMCRQGERAEHIYIVLHGRVRCVKTDTDESVELIGEYGAGESIGELEMLLGNSWPGTFHAIRDTEVACMPRILFDALALIHPEISLNISRILARKSVANKVSAVALESRQTNLRTVAIIPVNPSMHRLTVDFAQVLREELAAMDSTLLLDSATVIDMLGKHAFSAIGKFKLLEWVHQMEEEHRIVLYVADPVVQSRWTQRCIRQADCILLVAPADGDSALGAYERLLVGGVQGSAARKELVLIHGSMDCPSGLTRTWLGLRPWILEHHHIYMPNESSSSGGGSSMPAHSKEAGRQMPNLWQVLRDQLEKYGIADIAGVWEHRIRPSIAPASLRCDDFGRLARRLLGRTVGLVLGGGGARGFAHIGVVRALVEAGIPVDAIGGTSIGAFMGALYARDVDYYTVQAFAGSFANRLTSPWRQLMDLTYPITSWFTGHAFNRGLWKIFGDRHVEDLWLPFYCVTTDIARSKQVVCRSGYVWRYVRASMSLSGFLPPLCDQGALLVDGGYLNNVPVDVMLGQGAASVIAIDVGAEDETNLTDYGDSLSGFWLIFQRLLGRKLLIPTLTEIQSRLAFVNCVAKIEQVKAAAAAGTNVIYLRPPVQKFGVMDFAHYADIHAIGYEYGRATVEEWRADGTLKRLLAVRERVESPGAKLFSRNWSLSVGLDGVDEWEDLSQSSPRSSQRRHVRRRSL
jgi:lysophospholipid hydrolase